ncbi:MAG: hypothetical protein Q9M19_00325 [Mariprofundaceae bacterium]|nr:hypothetical protein [Mariprofundaceae bacterium]
MMGLKRVILLMAVTSLLAACAGAPKPMVYKHPETKDIVLLQGDTLQCEPLFRKAGFEKVDTGATSE